MFAYCNNNPVNSIDPNGKLGVLFWSFVGAVTIGALSNGISTGMNGGTLEECLNAAYWGGVGAAAGFGVAAITGFSPQGNIAGRATATIITDLGTAYTDHGKWTVEDYALACVDAVMDMCYSTISYYYTPPIESDLGKNLINAGIDALTDGIETYLFFGQNNNSSVSSSSHSGVLSKRGEPHAVLYY